MFEAGGIAYVYLCYGMHMMFNVVTGREGEAGAVLIRAVTMLGDQELEAKRTNGPGKLTRALAIDRSHNGADLLSADSLYIRSGPGARRLRAEQVEVGPRVGIDYAGAWKSAPLRFLAPG
jgi:DNA-3-methyladenine glycosylase